MTGEPEKDRNGLYVLDESTCWELLASSTFGRLAYVDSGGPQLVPVNHAVRDRQLVLATRRGGKLEAALSGAGPRVVYEIDEVHGEDQGGWSVIVHGRLHPVLDAVEQVTLDRLGSPAWIDTAHERHWLRLEPTSITGRRLVTGGDGAGVATR